MWFQHYRYNKPCTRLDNLQFYLDFFFIRTRHDDDVFYCLYTCTVNLYCCWRSNYPKKVGGLGIVDHHSLEVDVCFVDIG